MKVLSGRRLLDLILNVLDYAETEKGKLELKMSRFPIKDVLKTFQDFLKNSYSLRHLTQKDIKAQGSGLRSQRNWNYGFYYSLPFRSFNV